MGDKRGRFTSESASAARQPWPNIGAHSLIQRDRDASREPPAKVGARTLTEQLDVPAHDVDAPRGASLGTALPHVGVIQRLFPWPDSGKEPRPEMGFAPHVASAGDAQLPDGLRGGMERVFGMDFSGVRVHQDESASRLGARAYAQGANLHFAAGQYDPGSERGRALIGHELAHVVQQAQGRVAPSTEILGYGVNTEAQLEAEADDLGTRAARGEVVASGSQGSAPAGARAVVQRHFTMSGEAVRDQKVINKLGEALKQKFNWNKKQCEEFLKYASLRRSSGELRTWLGDREWEITDEVLREFAYGDGTNRDIHGGEQHGGEQHGGEQHGGEQHGGEQHGGEQHGGEQHGGEKKDASRGGDTKNGSRGAAPEGEQDEEWESEEDAEPEGSPSASVPHEGSTSSNADREGHGRVGDRFLAQEPVGSTSPGPARKVRAKRTGGARPKEGPDKKRGFLSCWRAHIMQRLPGYAGVGRQKLKPKRAAEREALSLDDVSLSRVAWVINKMEEATSVCTAVIASERQLAVFTNNDNDKKAVSKMKTACNKLMDAVRGSKDAYLEVLGIVATGAASEAARGTKNEGRREKIKDATRKARRRLLKAIALLQKLASNGEFEVTVHTGLTAHKHCELRGADMLVPRNAEKQPDPTQLRSRQEHAIGVAKQFCLKCALAIDVLKEIYQIMLRGPGIHMETYKTEAGWTLPDFLLYNESAMKSFLGDAAYQIYQEDPAHYRDVIESEDLDIPKYLTSDIVSSGDEKGIDEVRTVGVSTEFEPTVRRRAEASDKRTPVHANEYFRLYANNERVLPETALEQGAEPEEQEVEDKEQEVEDKEKEAEDKEKEGKTEQTPAPVKASGNVVATTKKQRGSKGRVAKRRAKDNKGKQSN